MQELPEKIQPTQLAGQVEDAVQPQKEPVAEQIKRRGLMTAAIAVIASALVKAGSSRKTEAANGDPLVIGNSVNAATEETRLTVNASSTFAGLVVIGNASSVTTAINGFTTAGGGNGVLGSNNTGGGNGVLGECSAAGVGAQGWSDNGGGLGIRGVNTGNGTGLKGVSNSVSFSADGNGSGTGVNGKSGSGYGVFGQASTGYGIVGVASGGNGSGAYGSAPGYGVIGVATLGTGIGVLAIGPSFGVFGDSTSGVGVVGATAGANVPAVYGASYAAAPGKRAGQFDGDVFINGSYFVTGTKSALVPHPDGSLRTLYCMESPESYFEDFGEGRLQNGLAAVNLDSDFAALVRNDHYQVFLTPEGDSNGLYVTNKGPSGFEVREQKGGTGNLAFGYRIVAKRRDVLAPRLNKQDKEAVKPLDLSQVPPRPDAPKAPPEHVFPEPKARPESPGSANR